MESRRVLCLILRGQAKLWVFFFVQAGGDKKIRHMPCAHLLPWDDCMFTYNFHLLPFKTTKCRWIYQSDGWHGVCIIHKLGGGFKYLLFSPLVGDASHFDSYFSIGLKPPTRQDTYNTYSEIIMQTSTHIPLEDTLDVSPTVYEGFPFFVGFWGGLGAHLPRGPVGKIIDYPFSEIVPSSTEGCKN